MSEHGSGAGASERWNPRQLMDALIDCRPEWQALRGSIHADALYYVSIADLGRDLFGAELREPREPWTDRAFAVIERAFELGDSDAQNLCVVGLFESLQNQSFERGEPDLIERRLGSRSADAWGALIEGWTGKGIRTVAQWRASSAKRG